MRAAGMDADLEPLLDEAFSHVIQLLVVPSHNKFVGIGSAVLISTKADRFFAVTAGHVLDAALGEPVVTVGRHGKKIVRLRYNGALTTEPRVHQRRGDQVDLAVVAIDEGIAETLVALGHVFAPDSLLADTIDPEAVYAFIGYPHSLNKVKRTAGKGGRLVPLIPRTATLFAPARAGEPEAYQTAGADPRVNFVATFRHSNERRDDHPGRPLPNPRGISGGAAYSFGRYRARAQSALRIVGIGTEYHERAGLFVAANARAVRLALSSS